MSTSIFEPCRKLLESTFSTAWASHPSPIPPVRYEGVAFAQPANSAWVGFYVRWGEGLPVSIGPSGYRMERQFGAVIIQVFAPKNTGQKAAMENCDFAGAIFRMKTISDQSAGVEVTFRSPVVTDRGEDGEMLHKSVSVAFQADALF